MGEVMTGTQAQTAQRHKESPMSKKVLDAIRVIEKRRTYTARQFLPRTQGEDEWPVGVRFAVPNDKVGKERYVVGDPAHSVVHHGDWVLTNRVGEPLVCEQHDFPNEYEEVSSESTD